jgi:putative ABC transport system ATP-binding protein
MIELSNIRKTYRQGGNEIHALDGIDLRVAPGEFVAIMGPSGSGKSTLMHCLAGLDSLTSGQVFIGGVELSRLSDKELTILRRSRIGFVFQSFNLVPTLTAEENITLPLTLSGSKPDQAWFQQVVSTVGLGDRLSHRPSELSGGQQQRVAIARALAGSPRLLLADEPTGNLDSQMARSVMALLEELHRSGATIVMVTHDPQLAARAQRNVHVVDGQVVDVSDELRLTSSSEVVA